MIDDFIDFMDLKSELYFADHHIGRPPRPVLPPTPDMHLHLGRSEPLPCARPAPTAITNQVVAVPLSEPVTIERMEQLVKDLGPGAFFEVNEEFDPTFRYPISTKGWV